MFSGNFLGEVLSLYPVVTWILSYNIFLFQQETFCKEAFGNVSVYRHDKTQKAAFKKVGKGRVWKRSGCRCYTKVHSGAGAAFVAIHREVF